MAKKTIKERHLRGIPEDPSEAEFRAFRKMLPKLLKRYEGEHVAIYKGKLVGHDPDSGELARRTFKKLGDVPFILPKVSRNWPEIVELPSPEEVVLPKRNGRKKMAKSITAKLLDGRELLKDPLEEEFRAFRKMLPRLLKRYKDEYVAIYKGKLLGLHVDDCELAQRAYEKVGKVPFLLTKVSRTRQLKNSLLRRSFSHVAI